MAGRIQTMNSRKKTTTHFVIIVLTIALILAVSFLLHILFSRSITDLTVEILAAVLGVVLVVASVGVTIHFQQKAEKEREFHIEVFRTKLELYQKILESITSSDDDHVITPCEIEKIRNMSRIVALVGSKQLLEALASFVKRITNEGQLNPKNSRYDGTGTAQAIIQKMREDLDVVEDDVAYEVQQLNEVHEIQRLAEKNVGSAERGTRSRPRPTSA